MARITDDCLKHLPLASLERRPACVVPEMTCLYRAGFRCCHAGLHKDKCPRVEMNQIFTELLVGKSLTEN